MVYNVNITLANVQNSNLATTPIKICKLAHMIYLRTSTYHNMLV